MKIGDTLYHFDINRRVYTKPAPGRSWGDLIYAGHFHPSKIIGENSRSWLLEWGEKADKRDPRKHNFYTAEQMEDNIWIHEHRYHLSRMVQEMQDAATLRKIAELVGYSAQDDVGK